MAFEWIARVSKFKTGSPAQKAVLFALANYADENGRCYPSIKKIGEITEQSESTIKRALCDLVQGGFIKKVKRKRRKNGTLSVYEYQILTTDHCDQRSDLPEVMMTPKPEVRVTSQKPVISEPIKTTPSGCQKSIRTKSKNIRSLREIETHDLSGYVENWFRENCPDVNRFTLREELVLYCRAKGKSYKDYWAALQSWANRRQIELNERENNGKRYDSSAESLFVGFSQVDIR